MGSQGGNNEVKFDRSSNEKKKKKKKKLSMCWHRASLKKSMVPSLPDLWTFNWIAFKIVYGDLFDRPMVISLKVTQKGHEGSNSGRRSNAITQFNGYVPVISR